MTFDRLIVQIHFKFNHRRHCESYSKCISCTNKLKTTYVLFSLFPFQRQNGKKLYSNSRNNLIIKNHESLKVKMGRFRYFYYFFIFIFIFPPVGILNPSFFLMYTNCIVDNFKTPIHFVFSWLSKLVRGEILVKLKTRKE